MKVAYLPFLGLVDGKLTQQLVLGEFTVNFYPDLDGEYLVNYPGRTDYFRRVVDPPTNLSSPPATSPSLTRLTVFRDAYGVEHLVFVQGAELRVVDGNGFRTLYTFIGRAMGSLYFPTLFVHQAKLLVLNYGDPPLLWDGREDPQPLGVLEVPLAPEVRAHAAPGMEPTTVAYGFWAWVEYWWPQAPPLSGPAENVDASNTKIFGNYQLVLQYGDRYGNWSRPSPPSRIVEVKPRTTKTVAGGNYETSQYLIAEWQPPVSDAAIYYVRVGRTLNLDMDDPQGGRTAWDRYYAEVTIQGTTQSRHVCVLYDTQLQSNGIINSALGPPPTASLGLSWAGLVLLAGLEDPKRVVVSEAGSFGMYDPLKEYTATDHVTGLGPLGDRVAIITRSTTEVLYLNSGLLAILSMDEANGSRWGRSIVDVGGALFGLWNRGFGFFDGQQFKWVPSPRWVRDLYVSDEYQFLGAIRWRRWYIATLRKDWITTEPNYLLIYDLEIGQWHLVEENVWDLAVWREGLLGVDDSIYELFKGTYPKAARLVLDGFVPPQHGLVYERTLVDLKLLLQPVGKVSATGEVRAETSETVQAVREGSLQPSLQAFGRAIFPKVTWNETLATYSMTPVPLWTDDDWWWTPVLAGPVTGYKHRVDLTFPAGHEVKLRGLAVDFGEDREVELA